MVAFGNRCGALEPGDFDDFGGGFALAGCAGSFGGGVILCGQ